MCSYLWGGESIHLLLPLLIDGGSDQCIEDDSLDAPEAIKETLHQSI